MRQAETMSKNSTQRDASGGIGAGSFLRFQPLQRFYSALDFWMLCLTNGQLPLPF